MTAKYVMRANVALAALAGLALRIFFVLKLPVTDSGDAPFYIELAWNWLKKGVYGGVVEGQLMPLDTRVPGYPAFLAAIFSVAGNSIAAARDGAGSGGEVATAHELDESGSRRRTDGSRVAVAAATLGRTELAHAPRNAIPGAALSPDA